jgi:hypothetical protein
MFDNSSTILWNLRLEVVECILLGLHFHLNPVEIDVHVHVLFHLGQVHVVEVSNKSNVLGDVQFVDHIDGIKCEVTD